jgi:prepilin-type processing-associated H-X9-DG protein
MLLVVAIMAILAALFFPVLARGKSSAQRIKCVSNMRQLCFATQLYWDDNQGECFRYGGTPSEGGQLYWFGWMGPGPEGQRSFDAAQGLLYAYLKGRRVELCPTLNNLLPQMKLKATGATYGYGYNLFLSAPPSKPPNNITRVLHPSDIACFADAAQINTWQSPASPENPMLEEWYYIDNNPTQPNGHFRHAQKANVAFCDGHIGVESCLPGSIDQRMPGQRVGLLRSEILILPK